MSKLFIRLFLALVSLVLPLLIPVSAQAATNPYQQVCSTGGGSSSVCTAVTQDPLAGPNGAIVSVTSILALVAGIVSVIFIVIGGIKYVTSGGDSSGVSTAKQTIIAALVGLVIAALARPIVLFVIGRI